MTNSFQRDIMISIGAHVGLVFFIFVQAVLIPRSPIEITNAIRVDVVDLPKKLKELPPKAEKMLPPAAEAAPKPSQSKAPTVPSPKSKKVDLKKSQADALKKIAAMRKIEQLKEEMDAEEKAKARQATPTQVAGNQLAKGNSLTGLEKIEYERYLNDLEEKIRSNWNIPQWLSTANLRTQVQVVIDARGFVTRKILRRSSGNEVFDSSVLAAIESSSPFPEPPRRLKGILATSGIVFSFPDKE